MHLVRLFLRVSSGELALVCWLMSYSAFSCRWSGFLLEVGFCSLISFAILEWRVLMFQLQVVSFFYCFLFSFAMHITIQHSPCSLIVGERMPWIRRIIFGQY